MGIPQRWRQEKEVARACSPEDEGLACLSVRSGFDLLLEALALPPRSKVLVSAVTHPDMIRVLEEHGLRAVPLDLDPDTLAPRAELFERALTPRTHAVLMAHLFGGRVDLRPVAGFAEKHGLLLIEDCAQAFRGARHMGDPLADVSMFSFGTIKTATAVGGALLRVRDPLLLARMRQAQDDWPAQRRRDYAARLLKTLCMVLVGRPLPYRLVVTLCGLLGRDLDTLIEGASRAFARSTNPDHAAKDGLFDYIRRRPSSPLLALLARRLRTFDEDRLARRVASGEEVARRLPTAFTHPGGSAHARTHWLFPVIAPDPSKLVSVLRSRGFDASRATSSIVAVEAPPDLPNYAPAEAARMMSGIVFLPVYPELSKEALQRLILALREAAADRDVALPESCT